MHQSKFSPLYNISGMDAKYQTVSLHDGAASSNNVRRPSARDVEDLDDRHSNSGSSRSSHTEVAESLLGEKWQKSRDHGSSDEDEDDVEALAQNARLCRRSQSALFSWLRWGLDTVLLLAILGLVVCQQRQQQSSTAPGRWDFGGDFTGVGPRIDQQILRFQSDQSYAPMNSSEFFTDTVLQKWNKLMPIGMGFVWVNDTHRYHDLPTPIDWPEKTVFTTSVTHQLHCMFTIAQTYSGLKSGHPIPDDHHWHMVHCMDYMREAVMCNADIALEGHETTFPDDNGGSDGWDSKHVCKDYSQVKAYLESVRAYDDQLIY
ncbi:hypothetical protein CMQ_7834 [Grosmannia clavigera kw1407]|uniref:Oxidase ustYa n=1 Tax=Grosmannia clavigera (strain kw1407 / UAMH 11150) TaxID=655863 RepID=F0XRX6_GROCL|nr:uncharacterized protein CMQ_7834 [Grosmannia clavigera kw1407]EFW99466.1 hypothetical protein CMQ_7834 [Grosmannia clavigera kw1407]